MEDDSKSCLFPSSGGLFASASTIEQNKGKVLNSFR